MRELLIFVGMAAGCVTAVNTTTVIDDPVSRVIVDLGKGDLEVRAGGDDAVVVTADVGGLGRVEGLSVQGDVLVLDYRCGGLDLCGADVVVELPLGVAVEATVNAGDASLDGLDGDLWVTVAAGSIDADGLRSPSADLAAGAGDVSASFDEVPRDVGAYVGAGAVDLEVPTGAYDLRLATDTGSITVDGVRHDGASGRVLRVESGAGAVKVRGR